MSSNDEKYTDAQYKVLEYGNVQFDKNVMFIASGALGISFAFIENIIPDLENAVNKEYLITAWYFFAGVIFFSLVAHFLSILANRWAIAKEDCTNFDCKKKAWNIIIRISNIVMMVGLFFGIIFLVHFINKNI